MTAPGAGVAAGAAGHPGDRGGDRAGPARAGTGGAMQVPGDFGRAGWFAGGPAPGEAGPAVIAGHVDSRTGPAVFYRLRELRPGQTVLVERADGTRLRFVVEQARSYPKAGFPTAAVFGPVSSAALRLITCAGDFDRARGSYRDNLVVFARLAVGAAEPGMMGGWEPGLADAGRGHGGCCAAPWSLVVVLVLLVFAGGSWFYSGEIRAGALDAKPPAPLGPPDRGAGGRDPLDHPGPRTGLAAGADRPRDLRAALGRGVRAARGHPGHRPRPGGAGLRQGGGGGAAGRGAVGGRRLRLAGRPVAGRRPAGQGGQLPLAARAGAGLAGRRAAATPG